MPRRRIENINAINDGNLLVAQARSIALEIKNIQKSTKPILVEALAEITPELPEITAVHEIRAQHVALTKTREELDVQISTLRTKLDQSAAVLEQLQVIPTILQSPAFPDPTIVGNALAVLQQMNGNVNLARNLSLELRAALSSAEVEAARDELTTKFTARLAELSSIQTRERELEMGNANRKIKQLQQNHSRHIKSIANANATIADLRKNTEVLEDRQRNSINNYAILLEQSKKLQRALTKSQDFRKQEKKQLEDTTASLSAAQNRVREIEAESKERCSASQAKFDELEKELYAKKYRLSTAEIDIEGKNKELESAREKVKDLEMRLMASSTKAKTKEEELRNEIERLSREVTDTEETSRDKSKQLKISIDSLKEVRNLNKEHQSTISDLNVKLGTNRTVNRSMFKDLKAAKATLATNKETIKEKDLEIENKDKAIQDAESHSRSLEEKIRALESSIDASKDSIKAKADEIRSSTEANTKLAEQLDSAKTKLRDREKKLNTSNEANRDLVKNLGVANATISSMATNFEEIRGRLTAAESTISTKTCESLSVKKKSQAQLALITRRFKLLSHHFNEKDDEFDDLRVMFDRQTATLADTVYSKSAIDWELVAANLANEKQLAAFDESLDSLNIELAATQQDLTIAVQSLALEKQRNSIALDRLACQERTSKAVRNVLVLTQASELTARGKIASLKMEVNRKEEIIALKDADIAKLGAEIKEKDGILSSNNASIAATARKLSVAQCNLQRIRMNNFGQMSTVLSLRAAARNMEIQIGNHQRELDLTRESLRRTQDQTEKDKISMRSEALIIHDLRSRGRDQETRLTRLTDELRKATQSSERKDISIEVLRSEKNSLHTRVNDLKSQVQTLATDINMKEIAITNKTSEFNTAMTKLTENNTQLAAANKNLDERLVEKEQISARLLSESHISRTTEEISVQFPEVSNHIESVREVARILNLKDKRRAFVMDMGINPFSWSFHLRDQQAFPSDLKANPPYPWDALRAATNLFVVVSHREYEGIFPTWLISVLMREDNRLGLTSNVMVLIHTAILTFVANMPEPSEPLGILAAGLLHLAEYCDSLWSKFYEMGIQGSGTEQDLLPLYQYIKTCSPFLGYLYQFLSMDNSNPAEKMRTMFGKSCIVEGGFGLVSSRGWDWVILVSLDESCAILARKTRISFETTANLEDLTYKLSDPSQDKALVIEFTHAIASSNTEWWEEYIPNASAQAIAGWDPTGPLMMELLSLKE